VSSNEIFVLGGGVIGLSIASALLASGQRVRLFDAGTDIRATSDAAAGMLAPSFEKMNSEDNSKNSVDMVRLGQASLALWPEFSAKLEVASGRSIDFRQNGIIGVHANKKGELAKASLLALEPQLSENCSSGHFIEGEGQVDPRRLKSAQMYILGRDTAFSLEKKKVSSITATDKEVTLTTENNERFTAPKIVIATGSATSATANFSWPPIGVVKGEALAVAMPKGAPLIKHVIRGDEVYLCPKADGRIIVGATERYGDDGLDVDPEAIAQLRRAAVEIVPKIADCIEVERWAGLRPSTPDEAPIIGRSNACPSTVIFALGHFRNGILLAPITAEIVADMIVEASSAVPIAMLARWRAAFSPDRFTDSEVVHHDLREFEKKEHSNDRLVTR